MLLLLMLPPNAPALPFPGTHAHTRTHMHTHTHARAKNKKAKFLRMGSDYTLGRIDQLVARIQEQQDELASRQV